VWRSLEGREGFLPHPPSPDDIIFEDIDGNHDNKDQGKDAAADDNTPEAPPTTSGTTPTNDDTTQDPIDQTD
jgi:hypothetical protein